MAHAGIPVLRSDDAADLENLMESQNATKGALLACLAILVLRPWEERRTQPQGSDSSQ